MGNPFDDNPQSDNNRRWKDGFSRQAWGGFSLFIAIVFVVAIAAFVWIALH